MVVAFLPGDPILEAAARANPEIFDYAYARNVVRHAIVADRAAARGRPGWQQSITDEAKTIHALGKELAGRPAASCHSSTASVRAWAKPWSPTTLRSGRSRTASVSPCAKPERAGHI